MDEKVLEKVLIGMGSALLAAVVGAVGWFAKEFRDYFRMRREMLQNVPKRTIAILDKPHGCRWKHVPNAEKTTIEVRFEFLVTNITKIPISLANATVTFRKRSMVLPVRVMLREVEEHNQHEPQASWGEHAIPPGETYQGFVAFHVPAPVAVDEALTAIIVICDQYGNRHRVKKKIRKQPDGGISQSPPMPKAIPCGEGTIIEERKRWWKTRKKVRGTVGFINSPHGVLVITQVKFSAPITPCVPKVTVGNDETPEYRGVPSNTASVVHFEADATACNGDTVTTDVIVVDQHGREYNVPGVKFVREGANTSASQSSPQAGAA